VARGLASPGADGLITLRNGRFVRYKLQGVEYLTTVLIDFTDVQRGQIPEPDRTIDNRTYWSADVSRGTTTTCCSRREADRTLSQVLSPTRTASRTCTLTGNVVLRLVADGLLQSGDSVYLRQDCGVGCED
jgi:hypothetical protein